MYPDSVDALDHLTYSPAAEGSETSSPQRSRNSSVLQNDSLLMNLFGEDVQEQADCRERIDCLLNSWPYKILSSLLVLFSIFGDDLRLAASSVGADNAFSGVFAGIFGFFFADITLQFFGKRDYKFSFAFWMDILATITLISDIGWIWDGIIGQTQDMSRERILKNVGRASRIAAKSTQIIQVVRLIRLLRIMKMYDNSKRLLMINTPQQFRDSKLESNKLNFQRKIQIMRNGSDLKKNGDIINPRQSTGTPVGRGMFTHNTFARLYQLKRVKSIKVAKPQTEIPNESKISKIITDITIKQVFGIVFVAAIVFPFLDVDYYNVPPTSYDYGLTLLTDMRGTNGYMETWGSYIDGHKATENLATLVYLEDTVLQMNWTSDVSLADLRPLETMVVYSDQFVAVYDIRTESHVLAVLDIGVILLLCILMLISAVKVIHDYSTTIIFGLERMIAFVKKISRDPMLLLKSDQMAKLMPPPMRRCCCCCWAKEQSEYGQYEIGLLEHAIHKIGVMLALGFGTAGCEIITQNIKKSGSLNPLIPGKMVLATFGFMSIMHFEKIASLLQEDLLLYVNKISKLLHCVCEKYQGAVNRNLGESFLVVWKFQTDDAVRTGKKMSINTYSQSVRQRSAFALIRAVKTLCKLVRSAEMLEYQQDTRITNALPFFTNKLTVGLHVGWGYEGPVGSGFKIDATYISPDVNIAARIESATKQYGVHILASESFYMRLDDEIQKYLRHIDTVVLKGSENVTKLYSFDLHFAGLGVSKHIASKSQIDAKRLKVMEAFEFNYFQVHLLFTQSQKIAKMREMYDEFFMEFYSRAIEHYLEGRWMEAGEILQTRCLRQIPMDGPSRNLLAFMEGKQFVCPPGWAGARVLGSK